MSDPTPRVEVTAEILSTCDKAYLTEIARYLVWLAEFAPSDVQERFRDSLELVIRECEKRNCLALIDAERSGWQALARSAHEDPLDPDQQSALRYVTRTTWKVRARRRLKNGFTRLFRGSLGCLVQFLLLICLSAIFQDYIGLVFVGIGIIALSQLFESNKQQKLSEGQIEKRELATGLLREAVLSGGRVPYFLYLRPFGIEGTWRRYNGKATLRSKRHLDQLALAVFEMAFARRLGPVGPVIAIGRPTYDEGALRLGAADNTWQKEFATLASSAFCIVIVPSMTPGSLWEVEWLHSNGHIERCVFVQPPEYHDNGYLVKQWTEIRATMLSRFGLEFPDRHWRGQAFSFIDKKTPWQAEDISLTSDDRAIVLRCCEESLREALDFFNVAPR